MLKFLYRKIIPLKIRKKIFPFYNTIRKLFTSNSDCGKTISLGKLNPHKTFYVIRADANKWGILTTWIMLIPHVAYAKKKGYIPIFDLKNSKNLGLLIDPENEGILNAWDLYFKQPQTSYTLDEIMHSKKIILANQTIPKFVWKNDILNANLPLCDEDFIFWQQMYKYCPFSDEILKYSEKIKQLIFPKNRKILAVSYRRSFEWHHYVRSNYVPEGSHLIRGSIESILQEIDSRLQEYKYDFFFFTSDDRESYVIVKEKFKDKCIFTDRPVGHYFENGKPLDKKDIASRNIEFGKRENDVYLRVIEYLADVYLCSQCDSFLSCGSSADFMAYLINNKKYEHFVQIKGQGDTKIHASDLEKK